MTELREFSLLSPAAARLGAAFARPKRIALACILLLTALGWLSLALLAAATAGRTGAADLGTGLLDALPRALRTICGPAPGLEFGGASLAIVVAMWSAMALAMMLPTAGPMIFTYAEIAETAARKHARIVSPFVLVSGYATVWLGFAFTAALLQLACARLAVLDERMTPSSTAVSGAIFLAAGVYQFTPLKHACLTQCQRPFPFFFTNWRTTPRGVFGLGLRQGLYCLGCCWAMMLVMFSVGTMNVVWMAALGIMMTVEKIGSGRAVAHAAGTALIIRGIACLVAGSAAHWPGLAA